MNKPLICGVFLTWIPVVVILFRVLGPRKAALIAVFGGFLFLPREADLSEYFGEVTVNKRVVSGLGLLLGLLIFDFKTLFRSRPSLFDLPMFGFVLFPLVSMAINHYEKYSVSLNQFWVNFIEWSVPYLIGRLYFGARESSRDLSIAVVLAGLVYVPVCLFEIILGSKYYVLGLIYGIPPHGHMVQRLGGWRPEGFLTNGIELSTWMALASTTAVWIGLGRAWRLWRFPEWAPALVLIVVTVACRGVYGYLCLAIGLTTTGLSRLLRSRWPIVVLILLPLAYLGTRITGVWDGGQLVEVAGKAGKEGSVGYRLRAEDSYLKKLFDHGPWFGFGGADSGIYDWWAKNHLWADGWWIHQIRNGGLVGLTLFVLALFVMPAALGLALPGGRSGRASPGNMAWGLALFVVLHLIDSLQNMAYLPQTTLIGGSLVSLFLARRTIRPDVPFLGRDPVGDMPKNLTPLLITVAVLALFEILGTVPRTPTPLLAPTTPEPSTPAIDPGKPK